MVCLMVEKLHDTERLWLLDLSAAIPRIPDKHPVQIRVQQSRGPLFDFSVPLQTRQLELVPIRWSCKGVLNRFLRAPVCVSMIQ
ncbi:hypothetical protein GGE67_004743 [Rhizobium leucaenae]|uniref:Uncharacterized protein n=1 Tax=Rhizobium leucaenae TaxID=29450 RepID=A0A7W7EN35_9HYPH|nr:hypothetical protein [Rhizobium leucaenae]MBB6304100.1 hypothetical protein [Rhizobium leucaenae]